MKEKVYIETTIVSYLAAKPSKDLVIAAHQQLTHEWWKNRRSQFESYVSQLVLREASAGHRHAASERLKVLTQLPVLEVTEESLELAREMVNKKALPQKAELDALHISIATVHGMHYLLTWNCKHIANAQMQPAISATCLSMGYEPPIICTPEELMGT